MAQTSPHFSLNIPEGSDVFNPLTAYNPNFNKIDNQMFKNQNAGVQNANSVTSGSTHQITRTVPDAAVFRFQATRTFNKGDTVTVDGIPVTALHTPDGKDLEQGAWASGMVVLAALEGTVMTVYTSTSSTDAKTLEGHPASYFGTAAQTNEAVTAAKAAKLTADAATDIANEALDAAQQAGGLTVETAWTNPAPAAAFTPKDVSVDTKYGQYKFIVIPFASGTNGGIGAVLVAPIISGQRISIDNTMLYATQHYKRNTGYTPGNRSVYIDSCQNTDTVAQDNARMIPLSIMFVK